MFCHAQEKHAKYKQYVGHSAHVTNVRFTHDDTKLVSTGGGDMSVMVWSHSKGGVVKEDTSGYISDDSNTDSEEEGKYYWPAGMELGIGRFG